MTSRSYFGKMNSTLGSVVPLAMFNCERTKIIKNKAGSLGCRLIILFQTQETFKTPKAIDNASVTVGRVGAAIAASPDGGRVDVAFELPPWLPWLSFTQADVEGDPGPFGELVVLPWLTPSTWPPMREASRARKRSD